MITVIIVAFVLGTCAGSFLNVVAHRMPRGVSIVYPSSRCGACGTLLAWYENLPILGWLALRGRCRHCSTAIPARYLFMELGFGLVTAAVVWAAFNMDWLWNPVFQRPLLPLPWLAKGLAAFALVTLAWLLITASLIDIEHMIIPDELTKGLQAVAIPLACCTSAGLHWGWNTEGWLARHDILGGTTMTPGTAGWWYGCALVVGAGGILACLPLARRIYGRWAAPGQAWREEDHRSFALGAWWFVGCLAFWSLPIFALLIWQPTGANAFPWWAYVVLAPINAVLGALVGWWLPYLVGLLGTVAFRRSAMGYGDVKLFGAVGAFLGPLGVLAAFAFATIAGTLIGIPMRFLGGGREFPFGPSLALGALVALPLSLWIGSRFFVPMLEFLSQVMGGR